MEKSLAEFSLFQAKAFRVHDGELQAVCHELLGAVGGQQQRVEAGVRGGQLLRVWAVPLQDTSARIWFPSSATDHVSRSGYKVAPTVCASTKQGPAEHASLILPC